MLQRILGSLLWNLPVVGGVGTGYSAGIVGKTPTASTGHLAVTANGTTMVLTMLPGWAHVLRDAGGSTFDPRLLFAESDANDTVTVTANATGSTRNDTVCLKIDQNTAPTSDGSNLVSFVIIAGAAGGGLSNAPADGNLYLPLANVAVANGATSIAQGNVTDLRSSVPVLSSLTLAGALNLPTAVGGAPAASSYGSVPLKFAETVLGAAVATVTFTGIPSTFRVLKAKIAGISAGAVTTDVIYTRFNNDATANYDLERIVATGASAAGVEVLGTANNYSGFLGGASGTANYAGFTEQTIPFYASTLYNKVILWQAGAGGTNLTGAQFTGTGMVKWRTVGTAINRLDYVNSNAANFSIGSFFAIYLEP